MFHANINEQDQQLQTLAGEGTYQFEKASSPDSIRVHFHTHLVFLRAGCKDNRESAFVPND